MKTIKKNYKKIVPTKLFVLLLLIIAGCSRDDEPTTVIDSIEQEVKEKLKKIVELNGEKQMTSFRFSGIENNGITVDISGEINEQGKTISIVMPSGTE